MKKKVLAFVVVALIYNTGIAQVADTLVGKYSCKIYLKTSKLFWPKKRGELLETSDTSITLCRYVTRKEHEAVKFILDTIPVSKINLIKVRKKGPGNFGKGLLIGGLIGTAVGFVNFDKGGTPDRFGTGENAGILAGCFGLLGGLIALTPARIHIDGKQEKYKRSRERLKRYSSTLK